MLSKMTHGTASGQSCIVNEMLNAFGNVAVDWLTDLCNSVTQERKMPKYWRRSRLVPVYNRIGDPLECGS